jgi:hypothetical protein
VAHDFNNVLTTIQGYNGLHCSIRRRILQLHADLESGGRGVHPGGRPDAPVVAL